jgi:hypothetical protein
MSRYRYWFSLGLATLLTGWIADAINSTGQPLLIIGGTTMLGAALARLVEAWRNVTPSP